MKKDTHPQYNKNAKVTCACGNEFTTGSTKKEIQVEICSACHPFFTGKAKLIDTAKRVDKFQKRLEKTQQVSKVRKGKKVKRQARKKTNQTKKSTAKK